MTVPAGTDSPSVQAPAPAGSADRGLADTAPPAPDASIVVCPYLASEGGAWRTAASSRDHRCTALQPPAPQTAEKQRRHCLSADHVDCPTFRAARAARASSLAAGSEPAFVEAADRRRRPLARTAPVVLEAPRLVDQATRLQLDRTPGQVALVGLMLVAFAVVAFARFSAGGPAAAPSESSSQVAVASGSPRPTSTPSPISTASTEPSPAPSASPAFRTTYKVKKGDTLSGIASRFHTTAAKLRTLNGLKSNTLHTGQVLKIP